MFVDASVIVAILKGEPEAEMLIGRLEDSDGATLISPVVRYEVTVSLAVSLARGRGEARAGAADFDTAEALVTALLKEIGAEEVPVTDRIGHAATRVARRYGKVAGHKADLNMGDCFAYACAEVHGVGLLYKERDFAETELG
jgi:ribonuclease VapC